MLVWKMDAYLPNCHEMGLLLMKKGLKTLMSGSNTNKHFIVL